MRAVVNGAMKTSVAAFSLLALLDDIASVLDDVAVLTKVAAKKTSGVLGDDLALNAEQVAGVRAERELPVVFAVAKGSAVNKAILVPAALAISAFAPWGVTPLLMLGGLFLCFEGTEKIAHKLLGHEEHKQDHKKKLVRAITDPEADLAAMEKAKIKGAIRTDFVLSAEIIVITLGEVSKAAFVTQLIVLAGISALMTVGVYGFVAGIVKLDDGGLYLSKREGEEGFARAQRAIGRTILRAAPYMMKGLSIVGTAAMFLVGGGILTHGIPQAHHFIEGVVASSARVPAVGVALETLAPLLANALAGIVAGALVLLLVSGAKRGVALVKSKA